MKQINLKAVEKESSNMIGSFEDGDTCEIKAKIAYKIFGAVVPLSIVFLLWIFLYAVHKGQGSILQAAPILLFMGSITYILYKGYNELADCLNKMSEQSAKMSEQSDGI